MSRIRGGKRKRQQVRVGAPDRSLTANAGLAAVTELCGRLGVVDALEHGKVSVSGGSVTGWVLRTTTTFRREDGTWKVVHRHADPISTPNPQGPLRRT